MTFARRVSARLSVRAKLVGAALLAGVALLLVSGSAALAIQRLQRELQAFSGHEYAAQVHLASLQLQLGLMRNHEKDALLTFDDAESGKRYKAQWAQALKALRSELQALQAELPEAERRAVDEALKVYEAGASDVIQRGINGQIVTATEAYQALQPAQKRLQAAEPVLDALAQRIQAAASDRQARVAEAAQARVLLILGLAGGTLLLFAPTMAWAVVSVTRPLDRAIRVAGRIAEGDLGTPVTVQGSDEMASLMRALAAMQTALHGVVVQVRESTDFISAASGEITDGSRDLSQRTEHTAADLQRTASSLSELAQLVGQAEQAAQSATSLSGQATDSARQGGLVVDDMVSRMEQLSGSSRRIGEISSLIDGIAFQTNLLALNAAVEAARAGEHGRGFGVVAQEVRGLSQRTAQAAREIRQLIGSSVDQIESGTERARAAGRSMQAIVDAVHRVSETMQDLSLAASGQSRDIAQVHLAVDNLDRMTQQNAALVEQSTAAAESLQSQARRLAGLVHNFRLAPAAA